MTSTTAITDRARRRRQGPARRGGAAGVAPVAAVATTAAFAAGGLLTQTVVVPTWQGMEPRAFLAHFRRYGPITGATLFPIELTSTLLLAGATSSAVRRREPARVTWALATAAMIGTVLLLPIHFAPANRALLDPDFPVQDVPSELRAWRSWNWARTGLAVLATGLSCAALTADHPHDRSRI